MLEFSKKACTELREPKSGLKKVLINQTKLIKSLHWDKKHHVNKKAHNSVKNQKIVTQIELDLCLIFYINKPNLN